MKGVCDAGAGGMRVERVANSSVSSSSQTELKRSTRRGRRKAMAKVIPGILGVLSGRIGDHVVCRRGKSVYVRAYVRPKNPKTALQQRKRHGFGAAVAAWRALSEAEKEGYRERAAAEGRTGYNLFISAFLQSDAALEEP
jgi:hypothetical protein